MYVNKRMRNIFKKVDANEPISYDYQNRYWIFLQDYLREDLENNEKKKIQEILKKKGQGKELSTVEYHLYLLSLPVGNLERFIHLRNEKMKLEKQFSQYVRHQHVPFQDSQYVLQWLQSLW